MILTTSFSIVEMLARDVTIFSGENVSVVFVIIINFKCCNTMLTYPCSKYSLDPLTYNKTGMYKGIKLALKHRLWVLVREGKEHNFYLQNIIFTSFKKHCIMHRHVA